MILTNTEDLTKISNIIKSGIQRQLELTYPSKGYDGQLKPVSGKYPNPSSNRKNTSRLYKSVNVYYKETPEGNLQMVIDFGAAYYWRWVDQGRRGKKQMKSLKYPPLEEIMVWALQRGLPQFRDDRGRFMTNLQRGFMLQSSIGYYGIYKTEFVQKGIKSVLPQVTEELGQWASDFLTELMEEKRIITKSLQLLT